MHFTYTDALDTIGLHQGDILRRTPAVVDLLRAVHPHYHHKPDYRFFIVLTQTCDLVRRSGSECRSPYISIAAVRPTRLVVQRAVTSLQYDAVERKVGFCSKERLGKLKQFVERLLNNNEENFFYLRAQPDVGLHEDHCAFLQLSIALKAPLHYETLLEAKVAQLTESFEHKLGYLVGSSYSRVGTEDWVPDNATSEEFQRMVDGHVRSASDTIWLDKPIYKEVLKLMKKLPAENHTLDTFKDSLLEVTKRVSTRKKDLLDLIEQTTLDAGVDPALVRKAILRLDNNPTFKTLSSGTV